MKEAADYVRYPASSFNQESYRSAEEPTPHLRWKDGVLEQQFVVLSFNTFGHVLAKHCRWAAVPEAEAGDTVS